MADNSRFSVSLNPELARMVEDYRFEHRISTKNGAVQRLLEMSFQSMESSGKPDADNELDQQERKLIQIARKLDPPRQELLLRLAAAVAAKDSPSIP